MSLGFCRVHKATEGSAKYSSLHGMLVHCRITPSSMPLTPIVTPGWRGTMWSKVFCLVGGGGRGV